MGIRGEPATPENAAEGLVWSAIVAQIDRPESQGDFVSVSDVPRERLQKHPWSIGGGGAAELKILLDETGRVLLGHITESIGITSFTLEDDIYLLPADAARRRGLPSDHVRSMVVGDAIRDWAQEPGEPAVFPYDAVFRAIPNDAEHPVLRYLWRARTNLANSRMFGGKTKTQTGLRWYEYGRLDERQAPAAAVNHLRIRRHAQPLRAGSRRKRIQPVGTRDQDGTRSEGGRSPRSTRRTQLLDRMFLDEAGVPQQGKFRRSAWRTPADGAIRRLLGARRYEAQTVSIA